MNTRSILIPALILLFLIFIGCSKSYTVFNDQKVANQKSRLTKLTSFSIALTAKKYKEASKMLIAPDREKIFDKAGNLNDGMEERLGYLRLSTLENDSSVRVINGKISGIYEKLPMLDMGPPVKIIDEPPLESSSINTELPVEKNNSQKNLKMVWNNFTAAIHNQDFTKALSFIDEKEQHSFFTTPKGHIKAGIRVRLAALDTAIWPNLKLKNEKLTRVWQYLPPATSLEEKTAKEFINHVNKGDWKMAVNMLTDYEREYLSDGSKGMKDEFKSELQNLTSKEWDSFFLYRGKLSGTLEWLGIGQYGQNK